MTGSRAGVLAPGDLPPARRRRDRVGAARMHRGRSCTVVSASAECFLVCLSRQPGCCRRRKCSWLLCVPSVGVCCPDNHVPTGGVIPSLPTWSTVPACRPFGRPRQATYTWRADDHKRHCRCRWHFWAATSSRRTQSGSTTQAVLVLPLAIFGGHDTPSRCNADRKRCRERCCLVRAPR